MISRLTPSFRRALVTLPREQREAAGRSYRLFANDPQRPSLHFKKLAGHPDLWSVRITRSVRAVGVRDGGMITWLWIGSHADFDSRFR